MKNIIILIAACGLLFGACSKPEPVTYVEGPVTFKVNAVNTIKTRGDINSTSPEGPIPELAVVEVYAFLNDGGNYIYNKTIDMLPDYSTDTNSATTVLADGTFPAGDYKFLGVGRIANDGYTPTALDGANFNDVAASIAAAGETNVIFAGNITHEVLASGATIEITISRQVTGIFTYLSNVPAQIGGVTVAYLRLRVSDANTSVNLTTGEGGTAAGSSYYAIDIPLSGQTIDPENNVYEGPGDSTGLDIVANSQIASNYALPIDGVTLTLELQDTDGVVLKSWSVVGQNGATLNFEPNILMAIGTKNAAGSELGADNAPGGSGANADDEPQSLLTDETITVNVLRNWGDVQNLTLEEQP